MPIGSPEQRGTNRLGEICHDLRTPLNTILGWIYVLRSSNPSKESLTEGLEAIERNAHPKGSMRGIRISRIGTGPEAKPGQLGNAPTSNRITIISKIVLMTFQISLMVRIRRRCWIEPGCRNSSGHTHPVIVRQSIC
jgi:signal transduction histidine kinase